MRAFAKSSRSSSNRCCWISCILCFGIPLLTLIILFFVLLANSLIGDRPFEKNPLPHLKRSFLKLNSNQFNESLNRFQQGLRIKSISYEPGVSDEDGLAQINGFIENNYPKLHSAEYVKFVQVNQYSRLYRIQGTDNETNPYLLSSHLDVVPAGNLDYWDHDPFAGEIVGDYIFGRGTFDVKISLFGILEALEYKISNDERPSRTIYLALGHDEEVGGVYGAAEIAKVLSQMLDEYGEQLDFILDEGMPIVENVLPGIDNPLAFIGVAEKGFMSINLTATGTQSHSSVPDFQSTIGILSKAISRLEENKPASNFGSGPEWELFRFASEHASFFHKLIYSNLWLFSPILSMQLSRKPETDAMQRTTTAVTLFHGGIKENVIPKQAWALINFRIHHGDTIESVIDHVKSTINDDRINVTVVSSFAPSKVSPHDSSSEPFAIIANSVMDIFNNSKAVPALLVGNTDSKYYLDLSDHIFRLTPFQIPRDQIKLFHGLNERITLENFKRNIEFFYRLIEVADDYATE